MRVILLTHGGAGPIIKKLSLLENVDLVAVFIETATTPKRSISEKIKRSFKYDGTLATIRKFIPFGRKTTDGDGSVEDDTADVAVNYGVTVFNVDNYHTEHSLKLMRETNADLGVVFGTNIIKESVFSIPKMGSINLHQGLAPYYRGGPPVFWELFNDEKEVGITVHFVAAAVDTGDIIQQLKVPLEYDPAFGLDYDAFIEKYRIKLKEFSVELIVDSVKMLAEGNVETTKQDTSLGKRYRLPVKKEKDELKRRLKLRLEASGR